MKTHVLMIHLDKTVKCSPTVKRASATMLMGAVNAILDGLEINAESHAQMVSLDCTVNRHAGVRTEVIVVGMMDSVIVSLGGQVPSVMRFAQMVGTAPIVCRPVTVKMRTSMTVIRLKVVSAVKDSLAKTVNCMRHKILVQVQKVLRAKSKRVMLVRWQESCLHLYSL